MIDEEHNLAHLIATKVFKWELITRSHPKYAESVGTGYYDGDSYICGTYALPCWPSNIKDAWALITQLERKGWDFTVDTRRENKRGSFVDVVYRFGDMDVNSKAISAEADVDKVPLAICRAIVKAAAKIDGDLSE